MTNALTQNAQSESNGALNNILIIDMPADVKTGKAEKGDVSNFSNILNSVSAKTQKTQSDFVSKAVKSNTSSVNRCVVNDKNIAKEPQISKQTQEELNTDEIEFEKKDVISVKNEELKINEKTEENTSLDANEKFAVDNSLHQTKNNKQSDKINSSPVEPSPVFSLDDNAFQKAVDIEETPIELVKTEVVELISATVEIQNAQNDTLKQEIDKFVAELETVVDVKNAIDEIGQYFENNQNMSQEQKSIFLNQLNNIKLQLPKNDEEIVFDEVIQKNPLDLDLFNIENDNNITQLQSKENDVEIVSKDIKKSEQNIEQEVVESDLIQNESNFDKNIQNPAEEQLISTEEPSNTKENEVYSQNKQAVVSSGVDLTDKNFAIQKDEKKTNEKNEISHIVEMMDSVEEESASINEKTSPNFEADYKTKMEVDKVEIENDVKNQEFQSFEHENQNELKNEQQTELNEADIEFDFNKTETKNVESKDSKLTQEVDVQNVEENLQKTISIQEKLKQLLEGKISITSEQSGALSVKDEVAKLSMQESTVLNSTTTVQGNVLYDSNSINTSLFNNFSQAIKTDIPQDVQQDFKLNNVMNQIGDKLQQLKDGAQKLTMVLRPNDLGRLSIELIKDNSGLTTQILAQNEDVRAYIERNIQTLRQQLLDAGINVNSIQIKTSGQEGSSYYDGNQNLAQQDDNNKNQSNQNQKNNENKNSKENEEFLASMSNYDVHFAKDFSAVLNKAMNYVLN